ncbi:hypothetical protein WICPIJ_008830 [Wickerhamomyces pijperi]|uniref:Uncharacterized protein n=1 Tax=Wickerhamomyces pijperi TaxID=599730 RepID=A0A9P8PVU0_WICPI|nr:hypothetical protein WICPIJ_008830 [Wickerhamomyces pijperi]
MNTNEESYQLAQYYYQYAQTQGISCQSSVNLKEYFSLLKLSLSLLFKITSSNQKTPLALKLKAFLLISKILQNESLDEGYQQYLDQIIVLTQNTLTDPTHLFFNLQAKYLLCKSYNITPSNYKQTLNIVTPHEKFLVFKYLRFDVLDKVSKEQAIQYLTGTVIPALPLDPRFKRLVDYIKLLEFQYCLQNNLPVTSDIDSIQPDDVQLMSMKHICECLYYLQYSPELKDGTSQGLEDKLRKLAAFLTNNQAQLNNDVIEVRFPFLENQDFVITAEWMNYNELNILFSFYYGLNILNRSFEKRKSIALFQNAKTLLTHELGKFNKFNTNIKGLVPRFNRLKEWSQVCQFFLLLEKIIVEDIALETFNKETFNIGDPILVLYVTAFYHQSNADLKKAQSIYDIILNHYDKPQNYEIVVYSLLNYYLITSGQISLSKRTDGTMSQELIALSAKKNKLLEEINRRSQGCGKFMVRITLEILYLVENPDHLSILELNSKVSQILKTKEISSNQQSKSSTFEKLKKTPQLLAILLYLNSSTLNANSDERQKTSQVSFNLAKYGNFKFLRYISGLLNLQNAQFANNFAQVSIQTSKLDKIRVKLEQRNNDFTTSNV